MVLGAVLIVVGVLLTQVVVTTPVTSLKDISGAVWSPIVSLDPDHPSLLSPASGLYDHAGPWGFGPMPFDSVFALTISTSGPVRVTISSVASDYSLDTIFDHVGHSFSESVHVGGGTYQIDILNQGSIPVEILSGSKVVGQQRVTTYERVFPFISWGVLVVIAGIALVGFGFLSKSRKRLSKK